MITYTLLLTNMKHNITNVILTSIVFYAVAYRFIPSTKYNYLVVAAVAILDLYFVKESGILRQTRRFPRRRPLVRRRPLQLRHNIYQVVQNQPRYVPVSKPAPVPIKKKKVRFSDKNTVRHYEVDSNSNAFTWDNRYIQTPEEQLMQRTVQRQMHEQKQIAKEMENPMIDNRHLIPEPQPVQDDSSDSDVDSVVSDVISVSSEEY